MNLTEQLRLWGATHAAARAAEHAATRGDAAGDIENEARRLREHANRLHREIYSSLGSRRDSPREANSR